MSVLHPASSANTSTYALSDDDVHTGVSWSRSPDADPWNSTILTLDGGGIRGYSSLMILKALMHEVAVWEQTLATPEELQDNAFDENSLLPCHYFDYMYGTSTGGLIGTMLGRLRMTVPQCLEIYREVGDKLFGKRRSRIPLATKYHHQPLESAVRKIVMTYCKQHLPPDHPCDGEDWFPWEYAVPNIAHTKELGVDFNRDICQSICLTSAHNERIDEAYLLRTYDHQYRETHEWITQYNTGADRLKVWQVTRATSAAPFYFEILEADIRDESGRTRRIRFKDGGIRENNPSGAAWSEYMSTHAEDENPAVLLSVGTGRPNESNDGFADAWPGPMGKSSFVKKTAEKIAVFRNLLVKYTDGEKRHKDMKERARGEHSWYKRLNVDEGLQSMPLDDWRRGSWKDPATGVEAIVNGGASLTHMEQVTHAYLTRAYNHDRGDSYAPPSVMIKQTAEKLVRTRRARMATREQNPIRWDTFMGRYLTGHLVPNMDGPLVHPLAAQP
ncbi:hypothetical protein FH972_022983 [Carpinus fangiana]|uniref:Patatin n=1 Tax=Carpinus fangiana TaxID=176857 RepID=A0A5N6KTV1_9ROSI|nr:hypothetical protein FH972_022983 [Carpinus fangiana]